MGKISFFIKKLARMDYKNIDRVARAVSNSNNCSYLKIFADILWCAIRYQAAPTDYLQSEMHRLTPAQRSNIVTAGVSNAYVKKFCDADHRDLLDDKFKMYTLFSEFLSRKSVFVSGEKDKEEFDKLASGLSEIIVKPALETGGGRGVKKFTSQEEAWQYALSIAPAIAEEVIVQHPKMSSLNPSSINTLRPISFFKDGHVYFLDIYIRIGAGGLVDNFCDGGMVAPVDIDTGIVKYSAVDENLNDYYAHPITGAIIPGFQVPFFDEAKKMVVEAASRIPELRYVGWDIAITEKGPSLIEGNVFPSHAFFNFSKHHPDGKYLRQKFDEIMGV